MTQKEIGMGGMRNGGRVNRKKKKRETEKKREANEEMVTWKGSVFELSLNLDSHL